MFWLRIVGAGLIATALSIQYDWHTLTQVAIGWGIVFLTTTKEDWK